MTQKLKTNKKNKQLKFAEFLDILMTRLKFRAIRHLMLKKTKQKKGILNVSVVDKRAILPDSAMKRRFSNACTAWDLTITPIVMINYATNAIKKGTSGRYLFLDSEL